MTDTGPISTNQDGLAIDGYDAVAYVTEGGPKAGSADFEHEWGGARWRFASAENRDRFAGGPQRYAPQYGGHCAFGASMGKAMPGSPQAWKVVDGRLFLNHDKMVRFVWGLIPGRIAKADQSWPPKAG